jgi:predicted transcriptional regulator
MAGRSIEIPMSKSIKVDSDLWKRVERCASQAGYSSPQELLEHALEKEVTRIEESEAAEQAERQLRGLGYLE